MFSLLKIRDFRYYFIGTTASGYGDSLTPFALAFAVLELTGSPSALGLVVLSTRLPIILFSLLGGAIGDRFSRRTIMLVTDGIRFVVQGVTAIALLTGNANVLMLVVLQLIASSGTAFFYPAAQGLVPALVDQDRLQDANSLVTTARATASVFAVGSAGALVALTEPGWAIAVDSLTFLVSALALARLPRTYVAGSMEKKTGILSTVSEGIGELRSRTWLWVWAAHAGLINLLVVSPAIVLGPFIAEEHLGGAPAWAAIGIGYTVGGVVGGLLSSRWKSPRPMVAAIAAFMLMAPMTAALAIPLPVWLIVPAAFFAATQVSIYNVFQTTTVQRELPDDLIARASSVLMLGGFVAAPAGAVLAGPIAAELGTRTVMIGVTVIAVIITVATLAVPAVWKVRADPRPAEESGDPEPIEVVSTETAAEIPVEVASTDTRAEPR